MIRTAMVGLGKMGLSHLAIDASTPTPRSTWSTASATPPAYLTLQLGQVLGPGDCFARLRGKMLDEVELDASALIVATPSFLHGAHGAEGRPRPGPARVLREAASCLDRGRVAERLGSARRGQVAGSSRRSATTTASSAPSTRSSRAPRHVRSDRHRAPTSSPRPTGPVVLRTQGHHVAQPPSSEGGGCALRLRGCHRARTSSPGHLRGAHVGVERHGPGSGCSPRDDRRRGRLHAPLRRAASTRPALRVNWSDESLSEDDHARSRSWGTERAPRSRTARRCQLYVREDARGAARRGTPSAGTVRYTTELSERGVVLRPWRGVFSAQLDYVHRRACRPSAGSGDDDHGFASAAVDADAGRSRCHGHRRRPAAHGPSRSRRCPDAPRPRASGRASPAVSSHRAARAPDERPGVAENPR